MSEGIPIPTKWQRYCANCGENHAPGNCPNLSASTTVGSVSLATAAEVAALKKEIAALSERLDRIVARTGELDRITAECLVDLGKRLSALEAARKDKKR